MFQHQGEEAGLRCADLAQQGVQRDRLFTAVPVLEPLSQQLRPIAERVAFHLAPDFEAIGLLQAVISGRQARLEQCVCARSCQLRIILCVNDAALPMISNEPQKMGNKAKYGKGIP